MKKARPQTIQQYIANPHRESWRVPLYYSSTNYKEYERAEKILLGKSDGLPVAFDAVLKSRVSSRVFEKTLIAQKLGELLQWSLGIWGDGAHANRPYPSGGGLYPLEVYLVVREVEGISTGVYHYNVLQHALELMPFVDVQPMIDNLNLEDTHIGAPSVVLLLSSVQQRSHHKYGVFANKLALLEAGHVGQNLYLVAAALHIKICGLGMGPKINFLNEQLRLDGEDECVLYGFVLGA